MPLFVKVSTWSCISEWYGQLYKSPHSGFLHGLLLLPLLPCPGPLRLSLCPPQLQATRRLQRYNISVKVSVKLFLSLIDLTELYSSRESPRTKKESIHPSSTQNPVLQSFSRYTMAKYLRQVMVNGTIISCFFSRSQIEPDLFSTISRRQNGQFMLD